MQRLFQQGEHLAHPAGSSALHTCSKGIAASHNGSSPLLAACVRLRAYLTHKVPMHCPRQRQDDKRRREQRPSAYI